MSKKILNSRAKVVKISLVALVGCVSLCANESDAQYELSDVKIDANRSNSSVEISTKDSFGGKTTISRKMIEATPAGNGDITSLLKTNHALKFSNSNSRSTTPGEIDPAEISINGSKSYQNNFMIDGMNINNDLSSDGKRSYSTDSIWEPAAAISQGMAIDSDFIESVDVYDSDISAKYGSFTGGVIDAKTRDPRAGFHGKISMSHTRDAWAKYHINEDDSVNGGSTDEFEDSANADNQPHFKKYTTRLNLEGFLTDNLGLMFGYTNTRSKIPLKTYRSSATNEKYTSQISNQRRNIDNYFLKALWYATDRLTITPSITYAPQSAQVYRSNAKDSFREEKLGGLNAGVTADYEFDIAKFSQKLAYSKLETSRDASNQYAYTWKYSDAKDWGVKNGSSFEGAFGDVNQLQKTLTYNADLSFNEFDLWLSEHKFLTGFEIKKQEAYYEIPEEFVAAGQGVSLKNSNCNPNDKYCSKDSSFGGKGQYLTYLQTYGPGRVDLKTTSMAWYLEDSIKIKNLTLRPGVRIDKNDYMNKTTVAPRFSSSYDLFGDGDTVLSFGRNRYYGRNIFDYRLRDGRNNLVKYSRRNNATYSTNFISNGEGESDTKFNELDMPYDDETSYGLSQNLAGLNFNFKYINRKGRDQIIRTSARNMQGVCNTAAGYSRSCYTYTNNGKSDTKTFRIGVKNNDPFKIYGTAHTFELSYDHFETKTNNNRSTTAISSDIINDEKMVMYKGKLIRYYELPVEDFSDPWTVTLTAVSRIPQLNLTVSNFFTYKGARDVIAKNGTVTIAGTKYDNYENINLGKRFSWDGRIGYDQKIGKDMSMFVNLDVTNILNKQKKSAPTSTSSNKVTYELGRQFWLEAGLKW